MRLDRDLIGRVVKREVQRSVGNVSAFAKHAGVSRKTVERVFVGDPRVTFATLDRVEGALGFPRDTLLYVGNRDWHTLAEIGAEPDLIRWVKQEATEEQEAVG